MSSITSTPSLAQDAEKLKTLPPRNEATFQAILEAAKDPNRDVRALTAWTLAQIGKPEARPALDALAKDPVPEVRAAALRALREMLPPGSKIEVMLDVPVENDGLRLEALAAARSLLFEQRDKLIEAARKSASATERAMALQALEIDPPDRSRPLLTAALKDPQASVRAAALIALGATLRADSGPAADEELARIILPFLTERTSDASFLVRAAACEALGRAGLKTPGGELIAAVDDDHFFVRRAAIQAAGRIGDPSAVPAVQGRLADKDYTVRAAACAALGEFSGVLSSAPLLSDRLADDTIEVRDAAQAALLRFPPATVYEVVLKYADDVARAEVRHRAWQLLGAGLFPGARELSFGHLNDPDVVVLGNSLRILRTLEDRRMIPRVLVLLHYDDRHAAPGDPVPEEAYQAAILFKLEEPVSSAVFALNTFVKYAKFPPMSLPPPPFEPSAQLALWAVQYLAALDRNETLPVMEDVFEVSKANPQMGTLIGATLERLTGLKHPVPPPPVETGAYFINVKDAGEK